jgi:cell division protein FtsB
MFRRTAAPPSAGPDAPERPPDPGAAAVPEARTGDGPPDLTGLPLAGITRRRMAWLAGILAVAWIVIALGRQVGEVSTISARADGVRAANAELTQEAAALERELRLISRQAYVEQQARAHRLGQAAEVPFRLADGAPPLPVDAPGSPATAVGAIVERPDPLDVWLEILFGPAG